MSTNTVSSITSTLNDLISTCRDGEQGFRDAAEHVKRADLKTLFGELSAQRARFAAQLQNLVGSMGEKPEQEGSVAAAIHRGWIDLKSALTSGDDHAVLAECERGEDTAVAAYRDALERQELPETVRSVIREQSLSVKSAHDRVKALRDSTQ